MPDTSDKSLSGDRTLPGPDPDSLHPQEGFAGTVFLRPLLARSPEVERVEIGAFTYYSAFDEPTDFFERNILYNFGFEGARLVIGRYCALAHGTTFILADANHPMAGPSTYPFAIFGGAWGAALPLEALPTSGKGDTLVGNDVWFGYQSLVMPGVTIGSGAIVASRAVVSRDVPPYAVVAGNPARIVRMRYDAEAVARLLALAWWDWPDHLVTEAIPLLTLGKVDDLEAFARERGLAA